MWWRFQNIYSSIHTSYLCYASLNHCYLYSSTNYMCKSTQYWKEEKQPESLAQWFTWTKKIANCDQWSQGSAHITVRSDTVVPVSLQGFGSKMFLENFNYITIEVLIILIPLFRVSIKSRNFVFRWRHSLARRLFETNQIQRR